MAVGKRASPKPAIKILVSSTVYGNEDLLDLIYALLTKLGYEVWMSHKGTIPVFPTNHAFEDCITAVDKCDIILSFITKQYGSGKENPKAMSITHRELRHAIETGKPRWVLAHHDVVFARTLLAHVGFKTPAKRAELTVRPGAIIDDLRVIDMYEEATLTNVEDIAARKGNWVQKYRTDGEAALFAQAQFHRIDEVQSFLEEQFGSKDAMHKMIKSPRAKSSGDAS